MAKVLTYIKSLEKQVWYYCHQRIYELENIIKEAQAELKMMKELQAVQGVCKGCNGEGKINNHHGDESVEECKACDGTGMIPRIPRTI